MAVLLKKRSLLIHCDSCDGTVEADEAGFYTVFNSAVMDRPIKYALLECKKCHSPILISEDSDFIDGSIGDAGWYEPVILFPSKDRQLSHDVPPPINRAFDEAAICLRAKAYTACAIMCRKVLEGLCGEIGGTGRGLAAKLKSLKEGGSIDPSLYEWATQLRVLGNKAAHGVDAAFEKREALDILDFTEAIIQYVFTFKNRFAEFKLRSQAHS